MLSAVADGSQDRVATRDGHGAPAADRTAILRQRFELRRGGQIMLDIEDRWLDPAHDVDLRLPPPGTDVAGTGRSEEHTSELQSLMRMSYAVVCLTNKKKNNK